jgi:hypothetical protein
LFFASHSVAHLFLIPQRSGGIYLCSRRYLFSASALVLSQGAGGCSPGPFLVPLSPEGHAFTRAVSSPPFMSSRP